MASSWRAPRVFMSMLSHLNSSGIQASPTPRAMRSLATAATEQRLLASSSGWRMASLRTDGMKRMRFVTTAMAVIAIHGSRTGTSRGQKRVPSG